GEVILIEFSDQNMENNLIDLNEYYDSDYSEMESESSDSETEFESSDSEAMNVPLLVISGIIQDNSRASVETNNIDFIPNHSLLSICTDKLLKKIGSKISRKLILEEKDSKFIREEATALLGLAVILLIFISNIKDNIRLNNKKSIMIPTEVLVDRYNSTLPNYILL
ncbi:807_t:CDS:2, partial [Scutellospora calospora]